MPSQLRRAVREAVDRSGHTRTSVWLPTDLVRAAKVRAAMDGERMQDVVTNALRNYLAERAKEESTR